MTQSNTALNGTHSNGSTDTLHPDVIVPTTIIKRDGRVVPFDVSRIENAMARCFASFGRTPDTPIPELAQRVVNIVAAKSQGRPPTVEGVQDIVEMVLQAAGEFEAAKRYILYRAERARERERRPVPDHVRRAFDEARVYFPTALQQFQFFDKYSRFNYELGRRETWIETVDRAVDYLYELAGDRRGTGYHPRRRTANPGGHGQGRANPRRLSSRRRRSRQTTHSLATVRQVAHTSSPRMDVPDRRR